MGDIGDEEGSMEVGVEISTDDLRARLTRSGTARKALKVSISLY